MTTPVRYAVVGYGLGGSVFHAPFIEAVDGAELAAVVARSESSQAAVRAEHPGAAVVGDPADLTGMDIDVAVVTTPNATHAPLANRLIDMGFAVVVDKPMATSHAEGTELVEHAEAAGVLLTCFQNRRWDSDYLTLRELIARGSLGDVHRFESRYERWRTEPKSGWKEEPGPAAGVLFDLGAHTIDQALQLFGPVTGIHSEVRTVRSGARVPDETFVALTHGSGVISHIWSSLASADPGARYRVLGSKGAYVKYGVDPQEDALRAGARPVDDAWGAEPEELWGTLHNDAGVTTIESRHGDYREFYRMMTAAVGGEGPVPVDPRDSLEVLRILEEATARAVA